MHNPKFDKYERVADFTEFDNVEFRSDGEFHHEEERASAYHDSADDVDVAADHGHRREAEENYQESAMVGSCDYSLHVYPTETLENKYASNKPVLYSLAVILFFAFTSLVFITYDCLVERRQKKVLTSANKTGNVFFHWISLGDKLTLNSNFILFQVPLSRRCSLKSHAIKCFKMRKLLPSHFQNRRHRTCLHLIS